MDLPLRDLAAVRLVVVHYDLELLGKIAGIARQAGCRKIDGFQESEPAVAKLRDGQGNIVLIDEDIEDVLNVMRRLATDEIRPAPAVIMMARAPTRGSIEDAVSAGFHSVVAKPFSPRTLSAHMHHALSAAEKGDDTIEEEFLLD